MLTSGCNLCRGLGLDIGADSTVTSHAAGGGSGGGLVTGVLSSGLLKKKALSWF